MVHYQYMRGDIGGASERCEKTRGRAVRYDTPPRKAATGARWRYGMLTTDTSKISVSSPGIEGG